MSENKIPVLPHISVVAAIIIHNNKYLCVRRGEGKFDYISFKWEFPGGKVEEGESLEQAIIREIKEELMINIEVDKLFFTVEHQYPDFYITMHSFICHTNTDIIALTEHIVYQWLSSQQLINLDWAAADIPIIKKIIEENNEQ